MDGIEKIRKFRWRIENFSIIKDERIHSDIFIVDGIKWRIRIYPKGDRESDSLSIYLVPANSETLPSKWSTYVQYGFAVIDQIDRVKSITTVTACEVKVERVGRCITSFVSLSELHNPERGFLVDDACLIEAYLSSERLISYELILKSYLDKHVIKEADCVKAAIDQKTMMTKPVDITTRSPTQSPSQNVSIESMDPIEEEMNTFFTSLESELSYSNILFSQEDAKEAIAKLDEALSITPVNLYNSEKFSPLKRVFKILASFDDSSTTFTIEQKNELFAIEDRLKELADRTAKAVQDKDQRTAKESMKLTITRNLDRNLNRYKEVESEVKRLLAERKEIFESSKKLKIELETLEKEWTELEANAKIAEEEEKTIETEWGRIKNFVSSIKGML